MADPATALRIAGRPFTSPCATCGASIPEELNTVVFALAADHVATVCDTCAEDSDPAAFRALADLRRIDATYWAIAYPAGTASIHGRDPQAAAYLATLTQGLAELLAMYLHPAEAHDTCLRLSEIAAEVLAEQHATTNPTEKAA